MKHLVAFLCLAVGLTAFADFSPEKIYKGDTSKEQSLDEVLDQVTPGSVVVVSEYHGFAAHHEHQVQVIEGLIARGFVVNVGMEFIDYTQQPLLDKYLDGQLEEQDFLKQVRWGAIDYNYYKRQILAPLRSGGRTFGLNAPRSLSGKVARSGIGSLKPADRALLPPNFTIGNDKYFDRFKSVMGGHIAPEKLERYFTAQSLWDDTSAWQVMNIMKDRQDEVLVIIFGDFHNAYYGGLPDRIGKRGHSNIVTVSQVDIAETTPVERRELIAPHIKYGPRADYVWTSARQPQPQGEWLTPLREQPESDFVEIGGVLKFRM